MQYHNRNNIIEGYIVDHTDHERLYKNDKLLWCDKVGASTTPNCMYASDKKFMNHTFSHFDHQNPPIRNDDLSMFGKWKFDNPHANNRLYRGVFNVPIFYKVAEYDRKIAELNSNDTNELIENKDDKCDLNHPPFYPKPGPLPKPIHHDVHPKPKPDPKPKPKPKPIHHDGFKPLPHHYPPQHHKHHHTYDHRHHHTIDHKHRHIYPKPTPTPTPIPTPIIPQTTPLWNRFKFVLLGLSAIILFIIIVFIIYSVAKNGKKGFDDSFLNIVTPTNTQTRIKIDRLTRKSS